MPTCPNFHELELSAISYGHQPHPSTTVQASGIQPLQRPNTGLDIDHDKVGESDATWMRMGQWRMSHLQCAAERNFQMSSIENQDTPSPGLVDCADQNAFSEDSHSSVMATLIGSEEIRPPLSPLPFLEDIWNTTQIRMEPTTRDLCFLTAQLTVV